MASTAISAQGSVLQVGTGTGVAKAIIAVAVGLPTILTVTAHGYKNGDVVALAGLTGTDAALLNGLTVTISNVTANTFSVAVDTTGKNITSNALPSPVQSAATTAITGGTLAGGSYYYKITALNANGETLASNEVSIASANLAVPVANAPSTATTGGTLAAATYYYKITALGASGETLASNEVSQATTGATSTVTVTWAAITGAVGYRIYRGTAAAGENVYYAVGAVTTFTDTGAASTAGTPPAANTAVSSTNANTVNWAAVTGATGYRVYRGTAVGAENVYYVVGAVVTYADTGAASAAGSPPASNSTGTVTATPTLWTQVNNWKTYNGLDGQASELDVTNLSSVAKEIRLGLVDYGNLQIEVDHDASDAGQAAVLGAYNAGTSRSFKLTLPNGNVASFTAYVRKFALQGGVDQVIKRAVELRISGAVTWA